MPQRILVIENDPDYQEILREILTSGGYEVVLAASGQEGLKRVKEAQPALIVLDVMMESAISGFEVAHCLKSRDPKSEYAAVASTPILILTSIHQATPFRFKPDGDYIPVEDFMEKPPDPDDLLQRIKILIGTHP